MGVADVAAKRQARMMKEGAIAILACCEPTVLFARWVITPHSIQLTCQWGATSKGRSQLGTVLLLREPNRRLVPAPRFVRGVTTKAPAAGCCCDHWLPPVRTQEAAAELSSADCCWKAHLQAPAKSSSLHKTVLNFNCSAFGFDTGNGSMTYCLLVQNLEKSRVGIDICVCSLLHAMVALLHQEGCLAKRCKYGRIFCMYTRAKGPALVNILPCPPIEKGGEWIHRASAHFHIVSRGQ